MKTNPYPPISPEQIAAAIRAFRAEECPACGVPKDEKKKPFCDGCFGLLPEELQIRISEKKYFIDTFHPALEHIKKQSGNRSQQKA